MNSARSSQRIAVLLAAEERLDGRGGAVATWVSEVYGGMPVTILAARSEAEPAGTAGPLNVLTPRAYSILDRAAERTAILISRATGKPAPQIKRVLLGDGRLWERAVSPLLRDFDVVHVHNRSQYGPGIRRRGYSGILINHMHNDHLRAWAVRLPELVESAPFDLHVFCSEFVRAQTRALFPDSVTRVIYNGIPDSRPAQRRAARDVGSPLRLVTAGRLIPEKGIRESILICRELNERGEAATLSIFGAAFSGDAHHRTPYVREIEELVAEANRTHPGSVRLEGFKPHTQLMTALSEGDLFLYPCQWDEPFGMVLAEAMSAGTPCLAPRRGGIPEIITESTGILLSPEAGTAEWTDAILDARPSLSALGAAAAAEVRERFSWEGIRSDIRDLYATLDPDPGKDPHE